MAGFAAEEKIASDGKTTLGVYMDGIFKATASGAINIGEAVISASGGFCESNRLGEFNLLDVTHKIKPIDKNSTSPQLQVGDRIYIYDNKWFESEVVRIDIDNTVKSHYIGQSTIFYTTLSFITYNLTQQRWECIHSGTPTWP